LSALRRGDIGLDIVALLSMLAALAFAEYLAAVVVEKERRAKINRYCLWRQACQAPM
jgi:hypothetical protein